MANRKDIRDLNTFKSQVKRLEGMEATEMHLPGYDYIVNSAGLKTPPKLMVTSKDIGRGGEFYTSLNTILISEGHYAKMYGREGRYFDSSTAFDNAKEVKGYEMAQTVFHESEHALQIQNKIMTGVSKSGLYFKGKFIKWKDIWSKKGKDYAKLPHEEDAVARGENMPSMEEWKDIQAKDILSKSNPPRLKINNQNIKKFGSINDWRNSPERRAAQLLTEQGKTNTPAIPKAQLPLPSPKKGVSRTAKAAATAVKEGLTTDSVMALKNFSAAAKRLMSIRV